MVDEMMLKKYFSQKVLLLRKQKGMTQTDLANALNYSDKAISKWERQESIPDIYTLYKIADLFNVKLNELFFDEIQEPENKEDQEKIEQNSKILHPYKVLVPFITALAVFFLFSLVFFVLLNTASVSQYAYFSFLFALPICSLILTIFAAMWWKLQYSCIFTSLVIWSTGLSLFLTLRIEGMNFVFIPCLILQVVCVLVYALIYFSQKNKTNEDIQKF